MLDSGRPESDIGAMRRLLLLRHAKTERAEPGARDRDRKLTKRGRGDAAALGAHMAAQGLVPDLAMVSPATRAQETWTLLAAAFGNTPHLVKDERLYNAGADTLMGLIAQTRAARTLLVVGHNPGLHDLALQLIDTADAGVATDLIEKLPTSGLIVIDLALDGWTQLRAHAGRLERFVSPRLIGAME
jgi:phosphohistidine phosphatase